MATVIDQILSIDSVAQKKLSEANALKRQLREETEAKIAEINALISQRAGEKIQHVREEEEARAAKARAAIAAETQQSVARLESIYGERHEKLEREIFQRVIGNTL